jgi:hypothetical protein
MKKWIGWAAILWCLLLLSYQPTASQAVTVWTEKGCNASYKPGEVVRLHYRVFDAGWTRVHKQYPDTHEEEIAGWRYFPTGGEYVELDTLGPECGKVTYTVTFWQEIPLGGTPCYGCGSSVVYVMEMGRGICSINVLCDMGASLFTDKAEYIAGVDSEAKITLNVADVYGTPLDADSVVIDVNGEGITAIKSTIGVYTASFTLTGRSPGEYTVTASIYKRDYPQTIKTTRFTLIVPVTVELSTDKSVYAQNSQVAVRAEVRDVSGRGVGGLDFDLSVSDVIVPFVDMGGGIYEAQLDLSGFGQGRYTADVANMDRYVEVDNVRRAEFTVGGLPTIIVDSPGSLEIDVDAEEDASLVLKNTGTGDASNVHVSVGAPPGIDVIGVSGYNATIPAGGQTTAQISLMGREEGEYTVNVQVSYQDLGGSENTASGSFPVTVVSSMLMLVIAGSAVGAAAVGAGAYVLKGKAGAKAAGEASKRIGEKMAQKASQEVGAKVAGEASKSVGAKVAGEASKSVGAKVAGEAAKQAGSGLAGAAASGGAVGGIVTKPTKCKKCGSENPPDSKFCSQCGAEL